ncbi:MULTISPECIES: tripartite tricarboxylate transporter substrate binding protein [unclassified Beijerinckia]|uniref:tripartite tricarboxylate transporter substrate binding protein n=1 Tax=unclassified Beijerinckia TaxID=2638183 RepID=UPI000898377D|nr:MULTISPECIES: tripartite tricarboxylate transporter substrate binding protein [unclassified Beijerinckia]MDH7798325.1 tripartite-type tricarboxylate transporter receptor subunit TctC [Beijerinckia sp. GAS462]SED17084.1 Tripartite-type tricarboxylate transporter, receptor component TctC [Beijerinckia sp. 28-YEA-48]
MRQKYLGMILGACILAGPHPTIAQTNPAQTGLASTQPIKILVGAPPGGTTDTMARAIAAEIAPALGQTVIIENRPGAGGNIAADFVAKAAPDGHTLLMSFTSHTINATLYSKLPFDPINDFTPISMIATVPNILVGHPQVPAKTLPELIALAKQKPGKLTIAIGGTGSSLHMAGEQFKTMANIDLLNVPYKGTAPAIADVVAGHVDLMFISPVVGLSQIRAGNLRAYAVTTLDRQAALPDVPSVSEVIPQFESSAWFGLFAPANLPAPIATKLNAVVVAALNGPKMRSQMATEGATPAGNSLTDFAAFIRRDVARWAPIVKQSGATVE